MIGQLACETAFRGRVDQPRALVELVSGLDKAVLNGSDSKNTQRITIEWAWIAGGEVQVEVNVAGWGADFFAKDDQSDIRARDIHDFDTQRRD